MRQLTIQFAAACALTTMAVLYGMVFYWVVGTFGIFGLLGFAAGLITATILAIRLKL